MLFGKAKQVAIIAAVMLGGAVGSGHAEPIYSETTQDFQMPSQAPVWSFASLDEVTMLTWLQETEVLESEARPSRRRFSIPDLPVPEPATVALLGSCAMVLWRRSLHR